jgi:hypothetical protein
LRTEWRIADTLFGPLGLVFEATSKGHVSQLAAIAKLEENPTHAESLERRVA